MIEIKKKHNLSHAIKSYFYAISYSIKHHLVGMRHDVGETGINRHVGINLQKDFELKCEDTELKDSFVFLNCITVCGL